ncbi:aspartate--tRNA ligase [Candidatus Shikimatogenerans bostrichidophilus]|uniref:aspartate--tRNA ligase n=1 Tax=Candidatus Shikimatogenerans bostrichidophilus TaxID=2943807 RepID=UPI002966A3B1
MYRTHNCGELNIKDVNKKVILSGWVQNIRKFSKYYFIDLRDFYGITQLFINIKYILFKINNEFIIKVKGIVNERIKKNLLLSTGEIEVKVNYVTLINKSNILPFNIENNPKVSKKIRLKYRYLDIRREEIKNNLIFKSTILNKIRLFFFKKKFIELETPFLVKSTPEGAREFIIPSRNYKGLFYSLPQSPQIFKQLLMIGGIDKYFQIVKCFRDEDLRKDRQPEFLQLDIEMSFINKSKYIINIIEKLIKYLVNKYFNQKIINFKIIKYNKSIKYYKTDKPDLTNKIYKIKIKKNIINKLYNNYNILSFILPNFLNIKNVNFKDIINIILIYIKINKIFIIDNNNKINNFFKNNKIIEYIIKKKFFSEYDILIILLHNNSNINCNKIFNKINKLLFNAIYKKNILIPIWLIDYPLFKYDINNKKYYSFHHPFTSPKKNNKLSYKSLSKAYDLIINGIEIGSGSIRINNKKLQEKIFYLLKFNKKDINNNFDFFLNALDYGTPPHGGIGIGIDRLILLLLNKQDIKDIIPFPKNYYNKDIMLNCPSIINDKILFQLGINI